MKIERITVDGEPRRRFYLVAEVTFRSAVDEEDGYGDYYSDDELLGRIEDWVEGALNDRDDGPAITFHQVPFQVPEAGK